MPLYKIRDLETAASINGARQLLQGGYNFGPSTSAGGYGPPPASAPKAGYSYPTSTTTTTPAPKKSYLPPTPAPKKTYLPPTPTRLPPLAELGTTERDDFELGEDSPAAVSPSREAVLPVAPDPIGLEFEQEIESVGITAANPRPVQDSPDFEISHGESRALHYIF